MGKLCDCCKESTLFGYNEWREPKHYICSKCENIYETVRNLKGERDLFDDKPVLVVYASKNHFETTWVESIHLDGAKGFRHMEEMQESEEYGHLVWQSREMKVKK